MIRQVIVDTGPLVAAINRRDAFHAWMQDMLVQIESPMLTCEAVISEACFLLRNHVAGVQAILKWLETGAVAIPFRLTEEGSPVRQMMSAYADVPMSLADACLVRMSEKIEKSSVLTLDSDFQIYRRHRNHPIPALMPNQPITPKE